MKILFRNWILIEIFTKFHGPHFSFLKTLFENPIFVGNFIMRKLNLSENHDESSELWLHETSEICRGKFMLGKFNQRKNDNTCFFVLKYGNLWFEYQNSSRSEFQIVRKNVSWNLRLDVFRGLHKLRNNFRGVSDLLRAFVRT